MRRLSVHSDPRLVSSAQSHKVDGSFRDLFQIRHRRTNPFVTSLSSDRRHSLRQAHL